MISMRADRARVAAHLQNAERVAARRDVSHLDAAQRLVRELLLNELRHYRAAGRYPTQSTFDALTPTFIDGEGTRCAMAHLMELGGEHALVSRIANERNHARVRELADEPRVLAWLEAAGLTVEEAATIQPSYGCTGAAGCLCGEGWTRLVTPPVKGVLTGVGQGDGGVLIEQIFGDGGGHQVGDVIAPSFWDASGLQGQRMLMPLTPGGDDSAPLALALEDGVYRCHGQGVRASLPISPENYFQALSAPTVAECKSRLVEQDAQFANNPCLGCGCTSSDPTSLGILLSIAGVLLARRFR